MNAFLLSAILDKDLPLKPVDAILLALIGIVIVFVVLIALMLIITIMGKIFDGNEKLKAQHPEWGEKLANAKSRLMFWKKQEQLKEQEKADEPLAKGSCGELKLINTDEREAAMIMAIVADETNTPLNELRFKSIKKVEEEK